MSISRIFQITWDEHGCPVSQTRRLVWGHIVAAVLKGG